MPNQGMGGSGSGPNSGGCWSSPSERWSWDMMTCPQMDLDAYLLVRTWRVYLHPTHSSAPSKSQAEPVTRVPSFSKWLPDGQTLSDIHGCHDPGSRHQVCPKVQQRQLSLLQSCHPVAIRVIPRKLYPTVDVCRRNKHSVLLRLYCCHRSLSNQISFQ